MRRTRHDSYAKDYRNPRYIVVWTMQHEVIECERIAPGADLRAAMLATMGPACSVKPGRPRAMLLGAPPSFTVATRDAWWR